MPGGDQSDNQRNKQKETQFGITTKGFEGTFHDSHVPEGEVKRRQQGKHPSDQLDRMAVIEADAFTASGKSAERNRRQPVA
ncbi:hypothetical protein SDC9_206766 [bioreactor metagenome]|uniref:Uncharacterized protein n=1 Tax=bioreactor metagenome TaxID=1076179 RepID=A0A645J5X6_9ZZZZ